MAEVVNRNASLKMTALLRIISFRTVKKNGIPHLRSLAVGWGWLYHGLSGATSCTAQNNKRRDIFTSTA
jgi:hypothetical protein